MKTHKFTPHQERLIAVEAIVDPRTVRTWLRGGRVQSTTAARLAAVLAVLQERGELPQALVRTTPKGT